MPSTPELEAARQALIDRGADPNDVDSIIASLQRGVAFQNRQVLIEMRARALVEKLDAVAPHLNGIMSFCYAHGITYSGPDYGEELKLLKEVLAS